MTDSPPSQKPTSRSKKLKTEGGLQIDTGLLPAGRLTAELKKNNSKLFWNLLDRVTKQASGLTIKEFWNLKKKDRDDLRALVLKYYKIEYDQVRASKQWIYIITHPLFKGVCKIGITVNVGRRMFQYQVGCPAKAYRLEYAKEYDDVNDAIDRLYQHLDDRRLKGEWFEVEPPEAIALLAQLNENLE